MIDTHVCPELDATTSSLDVEWLIKNASRKALTFAFGLKEANYKVKHNKCKI